MKYIYKIHIHKTKTHKKYMKIVVGGIKGGSGKTTIATNLTAMRASTGKKILLVDSDEQKSSSDWASQRDSMGIKTNWTTTQMYGETVHLEVSKIESDYDDIIIDVGGRNTRSQRSALFCADIFIIPLKPRSLDIWTVSAVNEMIAEIIILNPNMKCYAVINQADFKGSDNKEAMDIIAKYSNIKCLGVSIGNRKSFGNAIAEGLAVFEMKSKDLKAIEEMDLLYRNIFA